MHTSKTTLLPRHYEKLPPYEAWNGIIPDVNHFCVFECAAYVHVSKVERYKLDSKVRKCVLLGYGANQKGYRLYDIEHMKVIHSRDVIFDENSIPGIQKRVSSDIYGA